MATQVQYRRGNAVQNSTFVGAEAEITVDITNGTIRVHDGSTPGGSNIATVAYVDNEISQFSTDSISNGTSRVQIESSGGNVFANVAGTTILNMASDGMYVTGNILPTANITYDLGSDTARWNDLYLANSTIYLGNAQLSANATALTLTNPQGGITSFAGIVPDITTTGNISGNFILGNGSQLTGIDATQIQNGTSNVAVPDANGPITVGIDGRSNVVTVSHSANITSLFVEGIFSNPRTLTTGNLPANVNSLMIGPITVGNVDSVIVPDDATLVIL